MRKACVVATVLLLALLTAPALAQGPQDPNEVGVRLGYLYGDELSDVAPPPILDDDFFFGAYWHALWTDNWGVMSSLSFVPGTVTNLAGDDVDATVYFIDLSLTYQWNWDAFSLYVPFGIGYAIMDLDRQLVFRPNGQGVGQDKDFSYHVGLGITWPVSDNANMRFEGRYRIANELLDDLAETVDVFETTVAIGWTF